MILTHKDFQRTYDGSLKPRSCPVCGINFWSTNERAKYCSHACRQRAYLQRVRGLEDGILNNEENNEIFNDNNMSESQLIAEMQKNNALSIELALLKKDHEILKEKLNTFQDQSKIIGRYQIENEELQEELEAASDRITELEGQLSNDSKESTSVVINLKKELYNEKLLNLFRQAIILKKQVTFEMVKPLYPELKLNEPDTMSIDGYSFIRKANEKVFTLKKS